MHPRISFDSCDTIDPPVHESLDVPSLLWSHSEVSDCDTWPPDGPAPPDEEAAEPDGAPDIVGAAAAKCT